jgi:bifunctional UDP-N-acetylglucosamine pyrophosphorylase/glucosamine-1-phosphate N-acetyltransferase
MTASPIPGLGAIIMAAGLGKRMRSKLVKVLHPVAGRPMVLFAVDLADRVAGGGIAVVVGHQGERVKALVEGRARKPLSVVTQPQQLGTGHAVMQARAAFRRPGVPPAERYLILNGDTPLLSEETVRRLASLNEAERAAVTILTAVLDDPSGYGRVLRRGGGHTGAVLRVVEDRDAAGPEKQVCEVNVGTYVVNGSFLFEALDKLEANNAQREYYLTDIIGLAVERGLPVSALCVSDPGEALGINSRDQLALAERTIRQQICARWMDAGVTLCDPATTMIDLDVEIGQDTVVYPHVTLEGRTTIGPDCILRSHTRITDSHIGHRVLIQDSCVIQDSRLDDDAVVGPFAHLRPGSIVRKAGKVGNFVEMKKADLGEGSKANHLSYLGDVRIGKGVNVGAGTITCNYDGESKYETVIEDGVFIGSDTQLVAPVTVGRGAVVAAGTTVTADVPPDALAIARTPQVNRPGWASRRRALPPTKAALEAKRRTSNAEPEKQGKKGRAAASRTDSLRSKTRGR